MFRIVVLLAFCVTTLSAQAAPAKTDDFQIKRMEVRANGQHAVYPRNFQQLSFESVMRTQACDNDTRAIIEVITADDQLMFETLQAALGNNAVVVIVDGCVDIGDGSGNTAPKIVSVARQYYIR